MNPDERILQELLELEQRRYLLRRRLEEHDLDGAVQLADDMATAAARVQETVHAIRCMVEESKALGLHVVPGSGAAVAEEDVAFTEQ